MAFLAAAAPLIGTIGTLIGGGLSAYGMIQSGNAQAQAASYQAQVADHNAKIADDNARRAIERSQIAQQNQDQLTRAQLGTQEALQGASGLSMGGGSQILTRKSAAQLGRLDALNVRQEGEIERYNFQTQAENQRSEAGLSRMRGENAKTAGYLGAFSSLIGTATTVAKSDYFKRKYA